MTIPDDAFVVIAVVTVVAVVIPWYVLVVSMCGVGSWADGIEGGSGPNFKWMFGQTMLL